MSQKTLLIRNLPHCLSEKQVQDLLRHFGAETVRYMGKTGHMKHTAFATFRNEGLASETLKQLHQLNVLNFLLRVEFARSQPQEELASKRVDLEASQKKNQKEQIDGIQPQLRHQQPTQTHTSKINHLSKKWDIEYNIDESYSYRYPAPTHTTLQNIVHCMASVPKFYYQVLHLMNKMNLPPPFGELTTAPPLPLEKPAAGAEVQQSSSEESEMESSDDDGVRKNKRRKTATKPVVKKKRVAPELPTEIYAKRLKIKLGTSSIGTPHVTEQVDTQPSSTVQDVFEVAREQARQSKVNLPSYLTLTANQQDNHRPVEATGSFGQIDNSIHASSHEQQQHGSVSDTIAGPVVNASELSEKSQERNHANQHLDDTTGQNSEGRTPFITARELSEGRVPEDERQDHPVLKKYLAGEPCERLYVKNLAKQTTEDELRYIFGRYVDWNDDQEVDTFHIRHMTEGRMKGQAFITLPNLDAATIAVSECHSYKLHDKPMSVSYAKSKT